MSWPQPILLALALFGLGVKWHTSDSVPEFLGELIVTIALLALLWWGGFFDPLLGAAR